MTIEDHHDECLDAKRERIANDWDGSQQANEQSAQNDAKKGLANVILGQIEGGAESFTEAHLWIIRLDERNEVEQEPNDQTWDNQQDKAHKHDDLYHEVVPQHAKGISAFKEVSEASRFAVRFLRRSTVAIRSHPE